MANVMWFAWVYVRSSGLTGLIALLLLLTAVILAVCKRKRLALGLMLPAWQLVAIGSIIYTQSALSYMCPAALHGEALLNVFYWATVPALFFAVPLTCVVLLLAIDRTSVRFFAENKFWIVSTLVGLFSVFLTQVWLLAALFPGDFM
jgi:hypothetical protein